MGTASSKTSTVIPRNCDLRQPRKLVPANVSNAADREK